MINKILGVMAMALFFSCPVLADTYTSGDMYLTKPSKSSLNWDGKINGNFDIIAASAATKASSQTFTGQNIFNGKLGIFASPSADYGLTLATSSLVSQPMTFSQSGPLINWANAGSSVTIQGIFTAGGKSGIEILDNAFSWNGRLDLGTLYGPQLYGKGNIGNPHLGLNNDSPAYALDVTGDAHFTSTAVVDGNYFSVGGSTFAVIGGTVTATTSNAGNSHPLMVNTTGGTTAKRGFAVAGAGSPLAEFSYVGATGENRIGGIESFVFPTFYSGGVERMRITDGGHVNIVNGITASSITATGAAYVGGNLGIGTTSPSHKFTILGGTMAIANINNVANSVSFYNGAGIYENARIESINDITYNDSGYLKFLTARTSSGGLTEKMRIEPNGHTTIFNGLTASSVTATGALLSYGNVANGYGAVIANIANTATAHGLYLANAYNTADTFVMRVQSNNTTPLTPNLTDLFAIKGDGNVGIGTTGPGAKLQVQDGVILSSTTAGFGVVQGYGSSGGCLMFRDTDNAGWTECKFLDGVMSCATDADGVCD